MSSLQHISSRWIPCNFGNTDLQEDDKPMDLDKGAVVLDCLCLDWNILIEIQSALERPPPVMSSSPLC